MDRRVLKSLRASAAGRVAEAAAGNRLSLSSPVLRISAGTLRRARSRRAGRNAGRGRLAEALACAFIAALFALCGAVYFSSGLLSTDAHTFYGNIAIDGVDVGGMTQQKAEQLLSGREPPGTSVSVGVDGRQWDVAARDVFLKYDTEETVGRALSVGHDGEPLKRLGDVLALRAAKKEFTSTAVYDQAKLEAIAQRIARQAGRPPVNAALQFLPGTPGVFAYTGETSGKSVDAEALLSGMRDAFGRGGSRSLSFQSVPMPPDETTVDLKARTQLLGTYTTALTTDAARTNNVRLAAAAVNGAALFPGDVFSFNGSTGERTKDKGYDDAPVISGGQLVDAPGGGVCQVSSTVYDAALLSGLDISERHNHTWPVSYVPAGFDAMVDWNGKDLKIRNGSEAPVYLVFRVDGEKGLATAEFYGLPHADSIRLDVGSYEIVSPEKPVKYSNAEKPIGWSRTLTESRNGCRVSVYRSVLEAGVERRDLISNDFYPPQQGRVEIGTQPPAGENK